MTQLSLQILPKLAYTPENFLLHGGVEPFIAELEASLHKFFSISFVEGKRRSGKTHLSIYLANKLLTDATYPTIIDGLRLSEGLSEQTRTLALSNSRALIIDNAEKFFNQTTPGNSGPFVHLVEEKRSKGGALVFLSNTPISDLPCDEHVISRLTAGNQFIIGPPDEANMLPMINKIARQRGIALSERKMRFLVPRLQRNIEEMEELLERALLLSEITEKANFNFTVLGDALRPNGEKSE